MNFVASIDKLVRHTQKIRWLSLDNDESFLLSTAEDGIIVWDLKLRTHQVITNSPNLNLPAFWTPLRMDVFTKGFVCGMEGGELHVFCRRSSESAFHEVLDLDDEEAKDRIFNYLLYCNQQRRRAPTNESFPDVQVFWATGSMHIKATPKPGVIEIYWVEQSRPAVGDRRVQEPSQSDGKGDTEPPRQVEALEPPCQVEALEPPQVEALETAERSPGFRYGQFLQFFLFRCFLHAILYATFNRPFSISKFILPLLYAFAIIYVPCLDSQLFSISKFIMPLLYTYPV